MKFPNGYNSGPHPRTLRRAEITRKLRAQGYSLEAIGARLGMRKSAVWMLCKRFNITSVRDYGRKGPPQVPPVDPEKARRITEEKKKFWRMSA